MSAGQLANWEHEYEARIEDLIGELTPADTTKAMLRAVLERAKGDLARDAMAHLRAPSRANGRVGPRSAEGPKGPER